MPALIDIRRRIRSVKSTQQITKAMKMVSAAKLRRAQEAMFAARPYARKMMEVLNSLAPREVGIRSERVGVFSALRYTTAHTLAAELVEAFTKHEVDEVYLVYNEFKSVIQQRLVVDRPVPGQR